MLQVGIVGLANVGKSTLFNALLRRQQALVANYPFATIEPNIGVVPVPDERLSKLKEIIESQGGPSFAKASEGQAQHSVPIVPATIRFVDIAGLVKGASTGAGLGNKFLSHIREVDLIAQVVRAFPDEEIIREGSLDPKSDVEIINTELILADLQTLQKQEVNMKTPPKKKRALEKLTSGLNAGRLAQAVVLEGEEMEEVKSLQLLTFKKMIVVLNVNTVSEWRFVVPLVGEFKGKGQVAVVIDAKLEAELSQLNPDEQQEYLQSLGISDSGIDQFIKLAYETLGLISFLTAGEKEVRAWTIASATKAPQAAGTIHTDFGKGFIKAEVVDFSDFVRYNGWQGSRAAGKARIEGKDYIIKDGDVVDFKVST